MLVYLCKPFKEGAGNCAKNWNPLSSIINTYSTFLLLSYSKILFVSFNLLRVSEFHALSGRITHERPLFIDPSIVFFSSEHLPYAILAIFMLGLFSFLPLLILLLYPLKIFQKFLGCFSINWLPLHAFADAFNGCYKDGSNGTCDCRYFVAFYLIIRICFIALVSFATTNKQH